jgi:cytochrome c oxidase assembly factor CtaG
LVLLALASPLDALSEALVSAHMVQHLVLVACAAPLLAWGRPSVVALHGLPGRVRAAARRLAGQTAVRWVLRGVRAPLGALLAHTVALWFWHIPGFYEAALRVPALHWLQHLTFLGTALVYWGAVWHGRRNGGVVLLLLFAGATQGVLLGALLTLAPAPWYQLPDAAAGGFGLDPLDDQRLAGLLMWVPGAAVYLGAALFVGASWLARAEGAVRRGEGSRRVRQQRQWAGGP